MGELGKELWKKIELPQGRAFISDNVEELSDDRVLEIAQIALAWQIEGMEVLMDFLDKYSIDKKR